MAEDNLDTNYLRQYQDRNDAAGFQRVLNDMGKKDTAQPDQGDGQSFLSKLGTVAKNTAYGTAFEVVPQIIAGRFEAVKNAAKSVGDFGSWIDTHAPWLGSAEAAKADAEAKSGLPPVKDFSSQSILGIGGEPTTGIGQFAREASKFMTFYTPAMGAVGGAGLTGFMAAPTAGAISQFLSQDPNQAGISNLIEQFPTLKPIFHELATNPDSEAITNRLRHAVEGLGVGVAAEGITRGIKAAAHWAFARPAAQEASAATPEMTAQAQAHVRDAEAIVGAYDKGITRGGAPFTISTGDKAAAKLAEVGADVGPSVPGQVTAGAIKRAASLDDIAVKVNWENIDKGNLRGFIGDVASEMKGRIQAAKRGTISLKAQTELADQLGMTNEDLLARGIGKAFNSDEIIAGGKLLNASQAELYRLAHVAEMPTATLADAVKVNEQFVTHMGLLQQFLGGTGEVGRALGAMRAVHQQGALARAQFMKEFVQATGGQEGAQKLSAMLVDLEKAGVPPGGINAALARRFGMAGWGIDVFKESWGLGFLWRVPTQVRNIVGNSIMALQHTQDIATAEKFSALRGASFTDGLVPNESHYFLRGYLGAARTANEVAKQAFTTGKPVTTGNLLETGTAMSSPFSAKPPALSAQGFSQAMGKSAIDAQAFTETPLGKALDYMGGVVRVPGRFLTAEDEWFKALGYAGAREQYAYRQAIREGLTGEALANRAAALFNDNNIKLMAQDASQYLTFHNELGKFGNLMLEMRDNFPAIYFALPYVKTPSNLFKVGMEHSPIAFMVRQWRDDIAAGGAQRDMAVAKMANGFVMLSLLYDFAQNGHITGSGPKNPAEREAWLGAGRQPNSFHIGNLNIKFTGMGQLSPPFAFAGAVTDMLKNKDLHPEAYNSVDEWTGTAGAILAHSLLDQSYMQGLSNIVGSAMEGARGQEGAAGSAIRNIIGDMSNLVPGVPLARSIGQVDDPQMRQAADLWQSLIKNIYGLSDQLIPVRDVFGHEVKAEPPGLAGRIYNALSPFTLKWDNNHPAFNEMVRLHTGLNKIGWRSSFMGVPMNFRDYPEVLDYYRRLAGNELKSHPATREKIGLEDFLNRVVSGQDKIYSPTYQTLSDLADTGTDSGKATFLKHWAAKYREEAEKQIMAEAPWRFPEFYAEVQKGLLHKEQQKLRTFEPQALAQTKVDIQQKVSRPIQEPLPDRFGRPSVAPAAGGFRVPQ